MAPKAANTGAKRQTGDLNSWLKTSSSNNSNIQHKRQRSESSTMDPKPADKKQKSTEAQGKQAVKTGSTKPPSKTSSSQSSNTITINETTGDIFSCAPNTLLIHACNCQGSWSGGIALAFKKHYPAAFKVYAQHCQDNDAASLLGTALLIPPASLTSNANGSRAGAPGINGKPPQQGPSGGAKGKKEERHFIGCLFTSNFYGKRKDSPSKILSATGPAMEDLLRQVRDWNRSHGDEGEKVGEVRMCKINSGLFKVEWDDTRKLIEGIGVGEGEGDVREIEIVEREE